MSDSPDSSAGFVEIRCAKCGKPMQVAPEHLRRVVACPSCDADVEPWRATAAAVGQTEEGSAAGMAPDVDSPAGSPQFEPPPPHRRTKQKRQPDIRKLAKAQHWMILLVLLSLAIQFAPALLMPVIAPGPGFGIAVAVLYMGVYVLMVIGIVLLLNAQGNGLLMVIVCGMLAMFPCVNLILLILVNMSATRTLRRAGLRVGFMGVKTEDVERVCNPGLCSGCGYDLTGNVTGRCSECGRVVEDFKA